MSSNKENLTSSLEELSIAKSQRVPTPKNISDISKVNNRVLQVQENHGKQKKFTYEPSLFPMKAVKEVTDGRPWHDLSPNTRVHVNRVLKEKQDHDRHNKNENLFGGISITGTNFYGGQSRQ